MIGIKLLERRNFDTMNKRRIWMCMIKGQVKWILFIKSEKRDTMFVEHIAIWVRDLEKWPNFMKRILVPNVLKNITTPRLGFNLIFAF